MIKTFPEKDEESLPILILFKRATKGDRLVRKKMNSEFFDRRILANLFVNIVDYTS